MFVQKVNGDLRVKNLLLHLDLGLHIGEYLVSKE